MISNVMALTGRTKILAFLLDVCSHQRSWWYWNESLLKNSTNYFNSVTAKNWPDFKLGNVGEFNPDIVMGYGVLDK